MSVSTAELKSLEIIFQGTTLSVKYVTHSL